jgi:hypothetical protein
MYQQNDGMDETIPLLRRRKISLDWLVSMYVCQQTCYRCFCRRQERLVRYVVIYSTWLFPILSHEFLLLLFFLLLLKFRFIPNCLLGRVWIIWRP